MSQSERISLALSACAVFLFILLFAAGASKPLHLDNMDFPAAAEQTARTGLPIYYSGEQRPHATGLYHPPLYIYSLAVWMRFFGSGEAQVRLFGMTCAILLGGVVLAIIRTIFGPATMGRWMPWFWLIFLLNPYTIQTAAIADIDSTVYGPLLCAAILATLRISWCDGVWRSNPIQWWEYGLVSAVLFLCLWAKLTTILLVFPFIFLLLIARLGVRRAALATAAMVMASVAAFFASYWLYGKITGLDIGFTFAFTWMSFVKRGSSGAVGLLARLRDYRVNLNGMIPFMMRWIGLVPWLCATLALVMAAVSAVRERNKQALHYGLVLLLASASTVYYCAHVYTFGFAPFKYVFVYWGIILSSLLYLTEDLKRAHLRVLAVIYGIGAIWAMITVRDSLMLNGLAGPYWIVVVGGPTAVLIAGLALSRYRAGTVLVAGALALYCGLQGGIAVSQSRAEYSTTYDYGQAGFQDTVAFLRLNTKPDDVILSMKDIGYAARRRYFENYAALYGSEADVDRAIEVIRSGRVKFSVFTERRGQDQLIMRPRLQEWVRHHCKVVFVHGDYRVYQFAGDRPDAVPPSPTARSSR